MIFIQATINNTNMFKFERTAKKAKQPDMTPLIDVIFQLILFFMVTTTFVKIEAIDIFVSNKADVPPMPVPVNANAAIIAPLSINLKGDDLYINNSKVTARELPQIIGKEVAMDKNRPIKLVTQEGVNMQQLIDAVDLVRSGGGNNITLDTLRKHEVIAPEDQDDMPQKIPMPELRSTKNDKVNSGSFNFEKQQGWMPGQ